MDAKLFLIAKVMGVGFNPRARDGREGSKIMALDVADVSIHAPVMDAKGLVS